MKTKSIIAAVLLLTIATLGHAESVKVGKGKKYHALAAGNGTLCGYTANLSGRLTNAVDCVWCLRKLSK